MLSDTNVNRAISPTVHDLPPIQRPLLFTYRRCPYAMRARMALLQAGIDFDAHEISLRDKPLEMLRISPKGTVPVLVLPDQSVVDQSLDIMGWAFQGGDPGGWWGRAHLGAILGLLKGSYDLAAATAPLFTAALYDRTGGYAVPEAINAGIAWVGLAIFVVWLLRTPLATSPD